MSLAAAIAWTWIGLALFVCLAWAIWAAYVPRDQRLKMPPPSTRKPRGFNGRRWDA